MRLYMCEAMLLVNGHDVKFSHESERATLSNTTRIIMAFTTLA